MTDFKLFINFKTYPQGTGKMAVELAKKCQEVQEELGIKIIPIVQAVDLYRIKQEVSIPLWIQDIDYSPQGKYTGSINLEAVIEAGAEGCLLNHSEKQIPPGTIKQILGRVREIRESRESRERRGRGGFEVMVCCKTLGQMERLLKLKPDYIGYEISELIGGKISIVDKSQKTVQNAIKLCGNVPLIAGAGINTANDLKVVRDLGGKGVLVSSAIVLAENPKEKLNELLSLLKKEDL